MIKPMPEQMYSRIDECINESEEKTYVIANMLGVSRSSLYEYRTGMSQPSAIIIARMSVLFRVSADWLLGLSKEKRSI